ncbi:hypothetical protein N0S44_000063 [Escherichia coli]|nr:hypothetical protein [Escherichia coli]EJR1978913.1 hypothetical protein [Escherichia coli]UTS53881.1 hypothetical protein UES1_514 [Escherichia phage UE-S1]
MEQENNQIQLTLLDLINAAKIMEAAVARNTFKVEELVDVSPVVAKFVSFANEALEDIKAQEDAAKEESESQDIKAQEDKGE